MKQIINIMEGTSELVELTEQDVASIEALRADESKLNAEIEELRAPKLSAVSKLEALGLTEEEAKAVLGL